MTYLKAILLGLVQGIAEFLPISSSGHLAIARNLLNMEGAGSTAAPPRRCRPPAGSSC